MTIVLQPGQELRIIAADGSGHASRVASVAGMATTFSEGDNSPSASKDRSGRNGP